MSQIRRALGAVRYAPYANLDQVTISRIEEAPLIVGALALCSDRRTKGVQVKVFASFLTGFLVTSTASAQPYVCTLLTNVNGQRVDLLASKVDVVEGMPSHNIGENSVYAEAAVKLSAGVLTLEIHEDITKSPLTAVVVEASPGGPISYFRTNSQGTTVKATCNPLESAPQDTKL